MSPPTPFKRTDRIAELILQELARMLLTRVKDPRLTRVNLTRVTVTRDLGIAKVHYLLLGEVDPDPRRQQKVRVEVEHALGKASSFLRRELGKILKLRTTPRLDFYWDTGIEHGRKMDRIFDELAVDEHARNRAASKDQNGEKIKKGESS